MRSSADKKLKKFILKFWFSNLIFSLILYIGFRIVLNNIDTEESNFFEFILKILELFLDIYLTALFLGAMMVCSFTYFLNLNNQIRNNTFFSLLTFTAIPIAVVLFYCIQFNIDFQMEDIDGLRMMKPYFIVAFIYILFSIFLFIIFRIKLRKF